MFIEKDNLENFRNMFKYIPDKVFPSVLLSFGIKDKIPLLKFSDIDINQSMVINIETNLNNINYNTISLGETYRIPLTKNVKSVINNFDSLTFENNTIKGESKNKTVKLSMYSNDSDTYDFPNNIHDMLDFTQTMNQRNDVLKVDLEITREILYDLNSCLIAIDYEKDTDSILNFNINKKAKNITISSSDKIGNTFQYILENIIAEDTFKVKYDQYFISIIKILASIKSIDSFSCIVSNLMFGVDFTLDNIRVMLAITSFDKIK